MKKYIILLLTVLTYSVHSEKYYIKNNLDVVLPKINFIDVTLQESLDYIRLKLKELASNGTPNIIGYIEKRNNKVAEGNSRQGKVVEHADADENPILININATNIKVKDLLSEIGRQAKLNIYILDGEIRLTPDIVVNIYEIR